MITMPAMPGVCVVAGVCVVSAVAGVCVVSAVVVAGRAPSPRPVWWRAGDGRGARLPAAHRRRRWRRVERQLPVDGCGGRSSGSPRQGVVRDVGWKVRSRRLLLTTKTLEKAMAAPAIIGLSRPSAASGMAATL